MAKLTDRCILDSSFWVPEHMVPIDAIAAFKATVKDRDNEAINTGYFFFSGARPTMVKAAYRNFS